ncbi:hypothetical protein [Aeribacillus pallidus]|uniref:hypothetical protein n=1 Tax=Aeribacillus pallidus TaxID=33936 RepID=UPI00196793C4|nr:hypothetical protein [Aeribacillus pallidus]
MKENEIVIRENVEMDFIEDPNYEIIQNSGVQNFLEKIRPAWQAKNLVQRTIKILPVDPSSACQRIFNASIHDLREKVIIAGLDIAQATAKTYKLPPITSEEDITERYDTSKLITLAHRMGLLSRPEYRKIMRVYDIRKDLEHEDDEYEAGVEDVVYVFRTCVDIILANDPVHIIKITDIKNIIEEPKPTFLDSAVIEDYRVAPTPRQLEIYQMLISISLNQDHPDIVRENSYNAIASLRPFTNRNVLLEAASDFNDNRLDRRSPLQKEMRVAYVSGLLPYLRSAYKKDFYENFLKKMYTTSYHWTSYQKHGELLRDLKEVGGLFYIPEEIKQGYIEWLILCYIGEPGEYGYYGRNRKVFYSNFGAPLSYEILESDESLKRTIVEQTVKGSSKIQNLIKDKFVKRRLDDIFDLFNDN